MELTTLILGSILSLLSLGGLFIVGLLLVKYGYDKRKHERTTHMTPQEWEDYRQEVAHNLEKQLNKSIVDACELLDTEPEDEVVEALRRRMEKRRRSKERSESGQEKYNRLAKTWGIVDEGEN